MEDCHICYLSVPEPDIKKLDCSHTLCHYCYIHLDKSTCPYCRTPFKYNNIDNIERKKLGIELKYMINTPSPRLDIIEDNEDYDFEINIQININIHYSGVIQRQSRRRRRRNLSPEEIIERRKIIRRRCRRKWEHKNRRMEKANSY